jgi:hypothetical protein
MLSFTNKKLKVPLKQLNSLLYNLLINNIKIFKQEKKFKHVPKKFMITDPQRTDLEYLKNAESEYLIG